MAKIRTKQARRNTQESTVPVPSEPEGLETTLPAGAELEQPDMTGKKRIRRSPQQIAESIDANIAALEASITELQNQKESKAAEFDAKIKRIRDKIKCLQEKKKAILSEKPKPRKPRQTKQQKIAAIVKKAQKAGFQPEEVAEKLGINLDE